MMGRQTRRRTKPIIAAAIAAAGSLTSFGTGALSTANAALVIDLRATSINGIAIVQTKFVNNAVAGNTLTIGIFARVSGTDGNNADEWLQAVQGSVTSTGDSKWNVSTNSGVNGTFGWNGSGFQNGSIQDIDGDGDLDLGSPGFDITGKFSANDGSPESRALDLATDPDTGERLRTTPRWTTVDANTSEIRIGTVRLTYAGGGGDTLINFIPRPAQEGALWWEDSPNFPDMGARDGLSGIYVAGAPIQIIVPEPASVGIVGVLYVSLVRLRRRRKQNAAR